jgi:hypothetical protein
LARACRFLGHDVYVSAWGFLISQDVDDIRVGKEHMTAKTFWAFGLLMPSLDVDILHGMEGSYSCYSRVSTIIFLRVDIFYLIY